MRALLLVSSFGIVSCNVSVQVEDVSEADISFVEPLIDSYSNETGYRFKAQINSNNKDLTPDKATLEVFEGTDCDPSSSIGSSPMTNQGGVAQAGAAFALEDGKTYSARIRISSRDKTFQSVCSPWVGIDTQNPNPVNVDYPAGDIVSTVKEVTATWTSASDNGISGLAEIPYRLRLYGQPGCSGAVLQRGDAAEPQYKFKNLTQGVQYSVQVSSLDKAGNESVLSCSPYVEIDVYMPGFTLEDTTSSDGYSRVTEPLVHLQNDSQAAYWCFTTDLAFVPTALTDACPGGAGGLGGWLTSRPSTLPIGSGDGPKAFNLWVVRADGSLISINRSSATITLDQTAPGNFAVTGVGGVTDPLFDAWLTSTGQPRVKWAASADAVDYTAEIRTTANALVCSMSSVTVTELDFTGCPTLTNGATYKARVTAFDVARNFTAASDFEFTVDLDPPGGFSIAGLTGTGDARVDAFAGPGSPTVNYGSSTDSTHYRVKIDDLNGVNVCSLGTKADQSGAFDYASEGGVACAGLIHGGTYKAYVSAFDDGENGTPASNDGFSFQVDAVNPTLTLDSAPSTPTSSVTASFAFSTGDDLSGMDRVECRLDGGAPVSCVSPYDSAGLSEGAHVLRVEAFDIAGNSTVRTHAWTVDLTNPSLSIDSRPPADTNDPAVSISFHATDASGISGYTCAVDGGSADACASPLSWTASEGPHVVVIRATDGVGHFDEKTVSFIVDTTAPALTLTSVPADPSHSVTSGTVAFSVTDVNPVSTTCQIDGGGFAACASPRAFTGLGSGSHTAVVKAVDAAGNVTTRSAVWVIYNYSWISGGWSACSAAQPNWSAGGWSACSAAQPAYQYGGWGSCSVSCGGGVQYRSQTCPVVGGTQTRSVTCPVVAGTQTRGVQCQRSDGAIVSDAFCDAGSKPAVSQSCSRGGGSDCVGGAPASSQSCSRGGGSDCYGAQGTSQSCNPQSCTTWHLEPVTGDNGIYCMGITHGAPCSNPGYVCGAIDVNMTARCY